MALYDAIGRTYGAARRTDPRIAAAIWSRLGDAATVANIGAGTGSYEPPATVVAVEPSATMVAQRPAGAAPAVRGVAEALPLGDGCVDAVLAVLTVHHWSDVAAGLAELRRIARRRLVIFTWWPERFSRYWLLDEYFPAAAATDAALAVPLERLVGLLAESEPRIDPVPVPHDCIDGFGAAYWRRPEAYLDPIVRAGMSLFAKTDPALLDDGLARLADDVASGRWHERHADLLALDALDIGYCTVTVELER